jgi:hypothetical protein
MVSSSGVNEQERIQKDLDRDEGGQPRLLGAMAEDKDVVDILIQPAARTRGRGRKLMSETTRVGGEATTVGQPDEDLAF